ncbi:hypothetical protein AX14_007586 [Amanita brunnescens Koide BX004]|nr:hypothetical protein AX14_007586 [Amanita brunnescens Koide BX004]
MSDIPPRRPIPPNPPRWAPNPDPASIHIPGLDTSAPINDQIEQMDQLITIKLQNIDENFSKIHNIIATRILPAMKRHAAGTKPVREAAKFWIKFYEQAAQTRIPIFDDRKTTNQSTESSHSEFPSSVDPISANEDMAHQPLGQVRPDSSDTRIIHIEELGGIPTRRQRNKGKGRQDPPVLHNVIQPNSFSDEDSFDGLPSGLSPPILMSPARPPRSSTELECLRLGKTPPKEVTAQVSNEITREYQERSAKARREFGYPLGGAESYMARTRGTIPIPHPRSRRTDDSLLAPGSDPLDEIMASFTIDDPFELSDDSLIAEDARIEEDATDLGIMPVRLFAQGVPDIEANAALLLN